MPWGGNKKAKQMQVTEETSFGLNVSVRVIIGLVGRISEFIVVETLVSNLFYNGMYAA